MFDKICRLDPRFRSPAACALVAIPLLLGGCAQARSTATSTAAARIAPDDARTEASLQQALMALSPQVRSHEARHVAADAYRVSGQLACQYEVVGPPWFHNMLVNARIRQRGLCYQWAEDLFRELHALRPTTLELHWGKARAGSLREHNCVVVTAKGQPFAEGIVLDSWRHSGRLYWGRVAGDRYPWEIGESDSLRTRP